MYTIECLDVRVSNFFSLFLSLSLTNIVSRFDILTVTFIYTRLSFNNSSLNLYPRGTEAQQRYLPPATAEFGARRGTELAV